MVLSRQRKSGANFKEERLGCRMTYATWFLGRSGSLRRNGKPERVRSIWKRIRYRLEWVGLLMAAKLVPLLSRKSCYR
ncbi:MAG: hypothetical protein DME63_03915, partial [Verrucomicrobia bacterium]